MSNAGRNLCRASTIIYASKFSIEIIRPVETTEFYCLVQVQEVDVPLVQSSKVLYSIEDL